jgi:hypothetical protein
LVTAVAGAALAIAVAPAGAHYDHPAPAFTPPQEPLSSAINAGGENASWELITTIATGNPHTDLDFFTSGGETYLSAGTLGVGPNAGGQTIVKLTEGGKVAPAYAASHPSAACPSVVSGATALQHDVEATPKGNALPAYTTTVQDTRDAQLLIDATDGSGRCHDNGELGAGAPNGGLEIIDVTDPTQPKEIGLIRHIGNAHTVNVDPKRPHIAFDVTQDGVAVQEEDGRRANETSGNQLDGFEVIDLKSCMDFPPGTTIEQKRERCRPQVYRFRYPEATWATSHAFPNNLQSCHELEIYPDDRITCASITATLLLDASKAFDDNGTPSDYRDDKPRGTPLPCAVRDSSSVAFGTGAKITDCVEGEINGQAQPLTVSEWLKIGAPSLEGIERIGTVHHMGFGATADIANAPYDATEDIVAAHEAELTPSGQFVFTSDERGGGVVPGSSGCTPGADNVRGNGGIHAFPLESFRTTLPKSSEEAQAAYAKTSAGERAIYRAPTRTGPQGAFCTAHVFHFIPGQNRIFMGWYSQGTQVVDFVEKGDGTIDFKEAGWFTPENANTWTSAIFKVEQNPDGTFTYYGATSDGIVPGSGRGAIDVYKVTLPAPPNPAGTLPSPRFPKPAPQPCARTSAFHRVRARRAGTGVRLRVRRNGTGRVRATLLRASRGRRAIAPRRVRALRRLRVRARGLRNGYYLVRLSARAPDGRRDTRVVGLQRRGGRLVPTGALESRNACGLLSAAQLGSPVFGPRRALGVAVRLNEAAKVRVEVVRGARVVRTIGGKALRAGATHRLRVAARKLRRGVYTLRVIAERPGVTATATLRARRL